MNHCHLVHLILSFCSAWICMCEYADSKPPIFSSKIRIIFLVFCSFLLPLVSSPGHLSLLRLMWSPKAFMFLLHHLQVFALAYNFNICNVYIYYRTHLYIF